MDVMFDRVAGLDVGQASVSVCVRTPGARRGRHSETRTFKATTGSLRVRDWLPKEGVTIAAIESTSTYWRAPFYCMEEVMEVWLLNAAHMKAVPGRKTDVRDAEWIVQLLEHGQLRPSMVPRPAIRQLRMLTWYRVQLMGNRTREAIRSEVMLEDASITLSLAASSLTTVSARAMLAAMSTPAAVVSAVSEELRRLCQRIAGRTAWAPSARSGRSPLSLEAERPGDHRRRPPAQVLADAETSRPATARAPAVDAVCFGTPR